MISPNCKVVIIPRNKKSWQANFGISTEVRVISLIHIHVVTLMEFLIPHAWDQIMCWENYPITKYPLPVTARCSGLYDNIIYYRIIQVFIRQVSHIIKRVFIFLMHLSISESGVLVTQAQINCSLTPHTRSLKKQHYGHPSPVVNINIFHNISRLFDNYLYTTSEIHLE
jgi:hypothetical protein